MRFKLAESQEIQETIQLNESTYGLDKKYAYHHLLQTTLSDRVLFKLLSGEELLPGFTVHSNRRGSGIQKMLGTSSVLHHIGLQHGSVTHVKELENGDKHNKIHAELFKVIRDCLKDHENIFVDCYKIYEERYNTANQKFLDAANSGSDEIYTAIGLKFKAYEDYFRDVQKSLRSNTNLEILRTAVLDAINQFNIDKNLTTDTTEAEAKEIVYA